MDINFAVIDANAERDALRYLSFDRPSSVEQSKGCNLISFNKREILFK
jgi:hypothetical protein